MIVAQDNFADTDGVDIALHRMDLGGGWADLVGKHIIQNGFAVPSVFVGGKAFGVFTVAPNGVYSLTMTAEPNMQPGMIFRLSDALNYFIVQFGNDGVARLSSVTAGAPGIALATSTAKIAKGVAYPVIVTLQDAAITFAVGGEKPITVIDGFNQAATKCGFRSASVGAATAMNKFSGLTFSIPDIAPTFATPFVSSSPWNTPLARLAPVYSDPGAVQNVALRNPALGYTWASAQHLIFDTPADAPVVMWKYVALNKNGVGGGWSGNGAIQLATPVDIAFTGSDGYAIFSIPGTTKFFEVWLGAHDAVTGNYSANYMVENDYATGTGWGKPGAGAGIRAAGCSLLGGLIRQVELAALSIPHALPMVLSPSLLKAGTTQASQFVPPAVSADSGSVGVYTGTIPMGAHFALPPALALPSTLTPGGAALATAYRDYGGYVIDTAGNTVSLAQVEGPNWIASEADMNWIRNHLVMVSTTP